MIFIVRFSLRKFGTICAPPAPLPQQDYSLEYPYTVSFEGFVDKWAEIGGKMQCVLGLSIFWVGRKIIIQDCAPRDLDDDLKGNKAVWLRRTGNTTIPLPFHTGDLVQIKTPEMVRPQYGVVLTKKTAGRDRRCIRMAYIENYCFGHGVQEVVKEVPEHEKAPHSHQAMRCVHNG